MKEVEAAAGLAVWRASRLGADLTADHGPPGLDPLLPLLAELAEEVADLDHVVAVGPSLAAQAITRTLGRPLTALDTADPGPVERALGDRLDRTVVVVTAASDVTDAIRRAYLSAFLDSGLTEAEAARRFVQVDDVVPAGRSALSAAALVPAALAGVDVAELVDQASELSAALARGEDNPARALASTLAAGYDTVAVVSDGTGLIGLTDWVGRLLAASLGVLPVVLEDPAAPVAGDRTLTVTVGGSLGAGTVPGGGVWPDVAVNGPLGAQFLVWEHAIGLTPQRSTPSATPAPHIGETFTEGSVTGYGTSAGSVVEALGGLLLGSRPDGYLSITAYLDPVADAQVARLRPLLAEVAGRPVAFGWGPQPRPPAGTHLQITGAVASDQYQLGDLQAAQAAADRAELARDGRRIVRLDLAERAAGIVQLLDAARALGN
ncbi:glucose-6-phosphate isomerase [Phytohabitans aurantiacus]|uniref:Glucose-6-phosphate isomerase n=1 Tax=Phytohabitans aurantiacus TaxID=3016789 RepID=A0ABQ5QWA5_9ACTN|nr:glucose-6-phosphate isomerase [Phytohabitans aurantiacus]GLH97635.1 glucose-6-phosphate isomerase [Phytohabitans aurantiacus]